jgi:type IX secretion system PorP/SprF family membrane protein
MIIVLLVSAASYEVLGQDVQFTQYYAAPLYLNPAFAGSSQHHRFIVNHRNQWPSIPNNFTNYSFSYDYHMDEVKGGVGLLVTTDKAGSAALRSTNIGLLYSYKVNLENKWLFSSGLYFGYARKDLNFDKLIFRDQLGFNNNANPNTNDQTARNIGAESHFDFGTGFLIHNKKVWAGFSAYHLNKPNQSLLGEESRLPIKYSVHGGVNIALYNGLRKRDKTSRIAPSFIYKKQGKFDQLDLGLHFLYDPIVLGLWYRGIPVQQNVADNISQDAIALILGMHFLQFEVGYSYDFTISELGALSGGAHEMSLAYRFEVPQSRKMRRKDKFIPCPTFMKH